MAAKKKSTTKKTGDIPTLPIFNQSLDVNPTIRTIYADTVELVGKSNNTFFLRFFTRLPGVNLEEARISIDLDFMKKMNDLFEGTINNITKKK